MKYLILLLLVGCSQESKPLAEEEPNPAAFAIESKSDIGDVVVLTVTNSYHSRHVIVVSKYGHYNVAISRN